MDCGIPMREILSMFLGREVTVYFKNKRVQKLILRELHLVEEEENCSVKHSSVKVEDSIGFVREILTDNIESIDFGSRRIAEPGRADEEVLAEVKVLVREKNIVAANTRFDLAAVFERETAQQDSYEGFVREIGSLLEGGHCKECMARCMELVHSSGERAFLAKIYFTLSFVTNRFSDYDQSFYWLERYFMESLLAGGAVEIKEENCFWWKYLFHTAEFCSYENLSLLLAKVYERNRKLGIRSLSYVLALNNLTVQAAYVLGMADRVSHGEWEELESICKHLRSETDNKYHRFLRCREYVEAHGKYQAFDSDEKLEGMVYDFVPYRGYGFILGYDMIKYFFHMTEVDLVTLKSIRREICSLSHVSEEKLCQVAFSRTANSKRSYEAYQVV